MKRLIVALDIPDKKKVYELIEKTKEFIDFYKVGYITYTLFGNEIIKKLKKESKKIFLDLKLFDIPNTVKNTVKIISEKEIDMLTVHLMGGEEMIKNAIEEKGKIKIIGVTVLTSFEQKDLRFLGINKKIKNLVNHLVRSAYKWGIDGIVCSGEELKNLRRKYPEPFLFIVPGVRIEEKKDDQKRVITPFKAIRDGADFIVVGRPIYESKKPEEIVKKILLEIENGQKDMD